MGRTFTYIYSTNGIDLLEVRQTRAGNNELLSKTTYNAQHLPLTDADAAGQTTAYTYNALGQVLTETDARNGTTTYSYDTDGHLVSVNGPLPGTNYLVTLSYDSLGRVRTKRDINGHTLTFDYDALDRLTKITYPDSTFEQFGYTRLDLTTARDRVSRQTIYEFNEVRQMATLTDPLNRAQHLQWCKCGDTRSMTDPMGHTTTWHHDIQGRVISKEFADGSKINYTYENTTSRLRQRVDEKLQVTGYNYNRDDTLSDVSYANSVVTTPAVAYTYDPNYERVTSMTDGTGTTRYGYVPITGVASPGAGQLASVDGPLPNDTISFGYDDLGRRVSTSINGVTTSVSLDAIARVLVETNALGVFGYSYDGGSFRTTLETFPNGQTAERSYTVTAQDNQLKRITHKVGITPVSEFLYERDVAAGRITSWSQQAGTEPPSVYGLNYDAANQLTLATVTNAGLLVNTFAYAYDLAANRLTERVGSITNTASYNALNQLTAIPDISGAAVTNEWDAEQRLIAVTTGNQRTEFDYDGLGRRVGIRKLVSGSEVSNRRFVWCDDTICEERDFAGSVIKRFFDQGVKIESGPQVGNYYYTRDHLRSVRELTDTAGTIRARYAYDPFGRQTQIAGDVASDFGFAGMFAPAETGLNLTKFRAYDSALGRWLSRDPLKDAELLQGANIYAYVANNPVNLTDPLGLCCEQEQQRVANAAVALSKCLDENQKKKNAFNAKVGPCKEQFHENYAAGIDLYWCLKKPCTPPPTCKPPIPPKPPDPPKPPNPPKCRFYFGPFCVY